MRPFGKLRIALGAPEATLSPVEGRSLRTLLVIAPQAPTGRAAAHGYAAVEMIGRTERVGPTFLSGPVGRDAVSQE